MPKRLKSFMVASVVVVVSIILVGAGCQGPGDVLDHQAAPADASPSSLLPDSLVGNPAGDIEEDEFESIRLAVTEYGDLRVYVIRYPDSTTAINVVQTAIDETEECSGCTTSYVNNGQQAYLDYQGEMILDVSGLGGETEDILMWSNGPWVFTIENLSGDPELVEKAAGEFPY
ncbi:hypothetical protein ACFL0Z_02355 [Patescibacteria group bacterium]